jgi:hypothetical protein
MISRFVDCCQRRGDVQEGRLNTVASTQIIRYAENEGNKVQQREVLASNFEAE